MILIFNFIRIVIKIFMCDWLKVLGKSFWNFICGESVKSLDIWRHVCYNFAAVYDLKVIEISITKEQF